MTFWGFSEEAWREAMAASGVSVPRPAPYDKFPAGNIMLVGQELADDIALIAQKYVGYLYGHPTRAGQFGKGDAGKVYVEYDKDWEEPLVFADACEFCEKTLDDERVINRVEGFQEAINREVRAGRGDEAFPLTDLPLYLKRRLCIEWNHAFKAYLDSKPYLYYDFEKREIRETAKVDERNAVALGPQNSQEAPRGSVYFADS